MVDFRLRVAGRVAQFGKHVWRKPVHVVQWFAGCTEWLGAGARRILGAGDTLVPQPGCRSCTLVTLAAVACSSPGLCLTFIQVAVGNATSPECSTFSHTLRRMKTGLRSSARAFVSADRQGIPSFVSVKISMEATDTPVTPSYTVKFSQCTAAARWLFNFHRILSYRSQATDTAPDGAGTYR